MVGEPLRGMLDPSKGLVTLCLFYTVSYVIRKVEENKIIIHLSVLVCLIHICRGSFYFKLISISSTCEEIGLKGGIK